MTEEQNIIGALEIFSLENSWIPCDLKKVFDYIIENHRLPKARGWNGSEWIQVGIRHHLLCILELINEDMDDE
jgi:hypothetical protein